MSKGIEKKITVWNTDFNEFSELRKNLNFCIEKNLCKVTKICKNFVEVSYLHKEGHQTIENYIYR